MPTCRQHPTLDVNSELLVGIIITVRPCGSGWPLLLAPGGDRAFPGRGPRCRHTSVSLILGSPRPDVIPAAITSNIKKYE